MIASQAVITGAYSLTYQAIQLGLLPRLAILHTSAAHFGQIYIPRVNAMLLVGVLLLVFMFQTSSKLAHAYGIAVTTTMVVDGLIGFIVVWKLWKWKWWSAALLIVPLVVDRRDLPQREPAQAARRRLAAGAVRLPSWCC